VAELPAESRITSRIEGDNTVITIPISGTSSRGCFGGSWGATAVFGFLGITFAAQGFLTRNLGWVLAGMGCLVVTAFQLAILQGLPRKSSRIEISTGAESLSCAIYRVQAAERKSWVRSAVAKIEVEANGKLCVRLTESGEICCLAEGLDRQESEWIVEQIRHKWKMDGGVLVK
jgi:hypothetical protein